MSNISKLVIYKSAAALAAKAASYPCLVNYDPFNQSGVFDDGVGHSADMTFGVVTCPADIAALPPGPFDIIELVGFELPTTLVQE
jgi:hypothetical protein